MITVRKELDIKCAYDLSRLGDPEKLLFFDIETTGLSAYSSSLYLIGCIYLRNGKWQFVQWLTERLSDELTVLQEFDRLSNDFDAFIHFNGDTFDIPYLKNAAEQYGYPHGYDRPASIDVLKLVRKKKRFFGLPSLKLKAIERFLSIDREDLYTGGELIEVYHQFEKTKDERLLKLLLLHNEDDLKGMLKILPILNYCDLLDSPKLSVTEHWTSASGSTLYLQAETADCFPTPLNYETVEGIRVELKEKEILFRIPCFYGTLKYFYPNYRDYYYLPEEDTAIHKKVASFVDPAYRKPATKETCYIRSDGLFLPALLNAAGPIFKTACSDKKGYMKADDSKFSDYACDILKSI